jgi:hypothetical protein
MFKAISYGLAIKEHCASRLSIQQLEGERSKRSNYFGRGGGTRSTFLHSSELG